MNPAKGRIRPRPPAYRSQSENQTTGKSDIRGTLIKSFSSPAKLSDLVPQLPKQLCRKKSSDTTRERSRASNSKLKPIAAREADPDVPSQRGVSFKRDGVLTRREKDEPLSLRMRGNDYQADEGEHVEVDAQLNLTSAKTRQHSNNLVSKHVVYHINQGEGIPQRVAPLDPTFQGLPQKKRTQSPSERGSYQPSPWKHYRNQSEWEEHEEQYGGEGDCDMDSHKIIMINSWIADVTPKTIRDHDHIRLPEISGETPLPNTISPKTAGEIPLPRTLCPKTAGDS